VYLAEFRDGSDIADRAVLEGILRGLKLDPAQQFARISTPEVKSASRSRRSWRRKAASSVRRHSWWAKSCSGATTGWSRRSPWRSAADCGRKITLHVATDKKRRARSFCRKVPSMPICSRRIVQVDFGGMP